MVCRLHKLLPRVGNFDISLENCHVAYQIEGSVYQHAIANKSFHTNLSPNINNMTVLYPCPCYNEVCFIKGAALKK